MRPGGIAVAGGGIAALILLLLQLFSGGGGSGGGAGGLDDILSGSLEGTPTEGEVPEGQEEEVELLSKGLASIEDYWSDELGSQYRPAGLVIFTQGVSTGCGQASAAVGPFYCPPDEKAYIDIDFFEQLQNEFGAGGDFAQLYVLAHEYGHHMQTVLGTSEQVRAAQQRQPGRANELSVRLELQADCYAGLWARAAGQQEDIVLEEGDIEEGLAAAAAVGDDRIQSSAGAEVNPETWTHGSAEARQRWFNEGYETGAVDACDTFSASTSEVGL